MKNSFAILAGFLERGDAEVEGRALEAPADDFAAKLRDFARGKLSAPDRLDVLCQLNQNPYWVQLLAEDLKSLRQQTASAAERPRL